MAKLGKQLWKAVETAQGRSFVSDDFASLPDEFVIEFCTNQLPQARAVVRAFEKIAKQRVPSAITRGGQHG